MSSIGASYTYIKTHFIPTTVYATLFRLHASLESRFRFPPGGPPVEGMTVRADRKQSGDHHLTGQFRAPIKSRQNNHWMLRKFGNDGSFQTEFNLFRRVIGSDFQYRFHCIFSNLLPHHLQATLSMQNHDFLFRLESPKNMFYKCVALEH